MQYIEKLPETAKPIEGATNHWIDVDGSGHVCRC